MIYFLLFLFIALAVFFFFVSYKSVKLNREYELFYTETTEEINSVLAGINNILTKRQILSDDVDVQNLIRGMAIARDIINDYVTVRNRKA